jgi:hypothetical protein
MMLKGARGRKLFILALAGVGIAALLLLAASLSQIEFQPGKYFSFGPGEAPEEGGKVFQFDLDLLWRIIIWTFFALVPFSIIAVFIWPENLKYAIVRAVLLALFLILLVFTIRALKDFIEQLLAALQGLERQAAAPSESGGGEALPIGSARAPGWAVFPFLLGGLAFLALLGWWLRRLWLGRRAEAQLLEISALAGAAADELISGGSLRNIVLRCYREMSKLLSEQQQVPFHEAMTAREFEQQLRRAGVQDEHVTQLSRLFEEVRYGGRESGPDEEQEALECLREIERAYGPKEAMA